VFVVVQRREGATGPVTGSARRKREEEGRRKREGGRGKEEGGRKKEERATLTLTWTLHLA
jgi:hypothetical protein